MKTSTEAQLGIGELARRSGASIRSIRHYDDNGLLTSTRGGNGYRYFPVIAVTQVSQIQRLICAGFTLSDISGFPHCMLVIDGAPACAEVGSVQRKRLEEIERAMQELDARRTRLRALLSDEAVDERT